MTILIIAFIVLFLYLFYFDNQPYWIRNQANKITLLILNFLLILSLFYK